MTVQKVLYALDDGTEVRFEVEFGPEFRNAGSGVVLGKIRDAVKPAVEAGHEVLRLARQAAPDDVEVTFGIKVSGSAHWLIARAATEGSFSVKLAWRGSSTQPEVVQNPAVQVDDEHADGPGM